VVVEDPGGNAEADDESNFPHPAIFAVKVRRQFLDEYGAAMTDTSVIAWLMQGDPAIRWQVMRDLTKEPQRAALGLLREMGL
jgi:hypothetical protein